MNKITKSLTLAPIALLLLAGCANATKTTTTTSSESTRASSEIKSEKALTKDTSKYENIVDASFVLGKDLKVVPTNKVPEDKFIIDWYVDPSCPACVKLESIMEENLPELTSNGTYIRYNILSFLSARTVDDYSNRAGAYLLGAIEYAPEIAPKFFSKVMTPEYQPQQGEGKEDSQFKETFISVGGTEEQWEKILKAHKDLIKSVKENTSLAFNDETLLSKSENGKLSTPFVVIGSSQKALDFSTATDAESYFMESYNTYLEKVLKNEVSAFTVEGVATSYKVGDKTSLSVSTDTSPAKYEWIVTKTNNSERKLDSTTSEASFTVEEKDSSVTVKAFDKDNNIIETKLISITIE